MFCTDKNECNEGKLYGSNDLGLLDDINNFANSLIIFDDMGDNIKLPVIDSLYSKEDIIILIQPEYIIQ